MRPTTSSSYKHFPCLLNRPPFPMSEGAHGYSRDPMMLLLRKRTSIHRAAEKYFSISKRHRMLISQLPRTVAKPLTNRSVSAMIHVGPWQSWMIFVHYICSYRVKSFYINIHYTRRVNSEIYVIFSITLYICR